MRLAEAQQLLDALSDPLLRPALVSYFDEQKDFAMESLVRAVRQNVRDTMKEAALAGKVDAYENAMRELDRFAENAMKKATQ